LGLFYFPCPLYALRFGLDGVADNLVFMLLPCLVFFGLDSFFCEALLDLFIVFTLYIPKVIKK
jgi:hypothetical protein